MVSKLVCDLVKSLRNSNSVNWFKDRLLSTNIIILKCA